MKSVAAILIWNLVVFAVYAVDKQLAKWRKRRVSEACMITFTVFFGGAGAVLGMLLCRHKTRKTKFKVAAAVGLAVFAIALWKICEMALLK